MTRVLVTGGKGMLGRMLVPKLLDAGYTVRVMSRSAEPNGAGSLPVEWVQADISKSTSLKQSVEGVDAIIHAASNPRNTRQVDVEGTRRLLEYACSGAVGHFIYISIVGIERIPFYYYKGKVAAERLVRESGVPWTTLRATQFHSFIDMLLRASARLPVMLLPTDFVFQPVDGSEVADRLVQCVAAGHERSGGGLLPDFAGPQLLKASYLARTWLEAQGLKKPIVHLPLPGKVADRFRRGLHTSPEHKDGTITWDEWLHREYGTLGVRRADRRPISNGGLLDDERYQL